MRDALQEFMYWVSVRPEQVKPWTILNKQGNSSEYLQYSKITWNAKKGTKYNYTTLD